MGSVTRSNFALSDEGTMAFVPMEPDRLRIVRISRNGTVEPVIRQEDLPFSADAVIGGTLDMTEDGRYAVTGNAGNIILIDLIRGVPRQLTFDDANDFRPFFSPDDTSVYFQSNRDNIWKTWVVPLDGSAAPSIAVENEYNAGSYSMSDNGIFAMDINHPETGGEIWVQMPDGEQRQVVATRYTDAQSVITSDGSLIAYMSDMSGIAEIYVVPTQSPRSRPTQITTGGGILPKWVGDGEALMYRRGRAIFRIEMQGSVPVGEPVRVFDAPNLASRSWAYALSSDGETMLALQVDASSIADEIRVKTNFFEEIRRIAGPGSRQEPAQ